MSESLIRFRHLQMAGTGSSPGKFYDVFELANGATYAVYGKIDASGKAISIPSFDRAVSAKTAKGYREAEFAGATLLRCAPLAAQMGVVVGGVAGMARGDDNMDVPMKRVPDVASNLPELPAVITALATSVDTDVTLKRCIPDDGWVMEQKLDGHRIRIVNVNGTTRYLTRQGTDYTKGIPSKVATLSIPEGWAIDGELVGEDFFAFDILNDSIDLHLQPLEERRTLLETLGQLSSVNVIPQARTTEEKQALVDHSRDNGVEGVMLKRVGSRYPKGRNNDWLKAKFTPTADVIVIGVRDDGKESAALGIFRGNEIVEIGRCSLIGKPAVSLNDVVEVKYLYFTDGENGRLYQPTLIQVRLDKQPTDCDGADFRIPDKSVLSELPS